MTTEHLLALGLVLVALVLAGGTLPPNSRVRISVRDWFSFDHERCAQKRRKR